MTTEEKAKAYDDALNWMRELYPGLHGATKEDAEHYFPELRESEDERIRKYLIEELKEAKSVGELKFIIPQPTREECIAYLEKQKDHFRDDTKKVEKQDYSDLTDLERAIHRGFLSAGVENVPVAIIKETANECKRIANENANAEWNEEDESFYDSIMCEVIKEGMHPTPAQANWFKSLPERFNFQSKQEWSEEDERILYNVIAYVGYAAGERGVKDDDFKEANEWLRNLRSHSSWKPSEEQVDAVRYFVNKHQSEAWAATGQWKQFTALRGLLGDLLKLM